MATILKVLDISTAHLAYETRDMLDRTLPEGWPVSGGHIPYGYFIYAHDKNMGDPVIPADLWACIEFARSCGCSHLRFDSDGPNYEDLTDYSEEKVA